MGREYRLSRDARLREEGHGRQTRVYDALSIRVRRPTHRATVVGVDVGEDFLDLAIVKPSKRSLDFERIALTALDTPIVANLAALIRRAVGISLRGAIVLIDSPRCPRDISQSTGELIADTSPSRSLDQFLRASASALMGTGERLSMFPTPRLSYFAAVCRERRCKPHLRAIAREVLRCESSGNATHSAIKRGALFTRFMLCGFAAFKAFDLLGARTYESYPELVFRLWGDDPKIPSKGRRVEALRVRADITSLLVRRCGLAKARQPASLDEVDAEVLALAASKAISRGSMLEVAHPGEGTFAIPLNPAQIARLRVAF